ncbi:Hypothetical protein ORPV_989 [Orpheovirus IHUMI-LCC2]|uniref:Uncharacterized protein n=1 Tax=Orpheovirus IHUMI-LCC2 TaxID=2023057 RepID=A0A2I2L5T4_9VIRU|nr:Hypothetical protein ORPV_989 [Orpheovirus IHUMI-LCC2]SNW62893.1 Hypothetical protein ORPV_989 [Orpheovirus IHUMI-LCC2]
MQFFLFYYNYQYTYIDNYKNLYKVNYMDLPDLNYDVYRRILENADWKTAVNLCNNIGKGFQSTLCNNPETKQIYINKFLLGYKIFYKLPLEDILKLIVDVNTNPYFIFVNKDELREELIETEEFKHFIIQNYIGNFPYLYKNNIPTIIKILKILYPINHNMATIVHNTQTIERMLKLGENGINIYNYYIKIFGSNHQTHVDILKLSIEYNNELLYKHISKLLDMEVSMYDILNNYDIYTRLGNRVMLSMENFIQSRANYLLYCNVEEGRKIKDYNNILNLLYSKYPIILYNKYKEEWNLQDNAWKEYFLDKDMKKQVATYDKLSLNKNDLQIVLDYDMKERRKTINKIKVQDILDVIFGKNIDVNNDIFEYVAVSITVFYMSIGCRNYDFVNKYIEKQEVDNVILLNRQIIGNWVFTDIILNCRKYLSDSAFWEFLNYSQVNLPDLYEQFYDVRYIPYINNIYNMFTMGLQRSLSVEDDITKSYVDEIFSVNE